MIKIETEKIPIFVWAEAADLVGFDEAIGQAKNLAWSEFYQALDPQGTASFAPNTGTTGTVDTSTIRTYDNLSILEFESDVNL